MKLLRRFLYYQAVLWAGGGLAVGLAPRWVLVSLFNQPLYPDFTYVRACGVMALGIALLAVLVAQRIQDVWWWSWAFALTDAALVTLTALNALFGSVAAALWWIFALSNLALAIGLLAGMARAAQEKPFV